MPSAVENGWRGKLARLRRDTRVSSQGIVRPPTTMVKIVSAATFASASTIANTGEVCTTAGERRHQHEDQHGEQILDHQPSDGDLAAMACAAAGGPTARE